MHAYYQVSRRFNALCMLGRHRTTSPIRSLCIRETNSPIRTTRIVSSWQQFDTQLATHVLSHEPLLHHDHSIDLRVTSQFVESGDHDDERANHLPSTVSTSTFTPKHSESAAPVRTSPTGPALTTCDCDMSAACVIPGGISSV
jgi:hypothetical protein